MLSTELWYCHKHRLMNNIDCVSLKRVASTIVTYYHPSLFTLGNLPNNMNRLWIKCLNYLTATGKRKKWHFKEILKQWKYFWILWNLGKLSIWLIRLTAFCANDNALHYLLPIVLLQSNISCFLLCNLNFYAQFVCSGNQILSFINFVLTTECVAQHAYFGQL